MGDNRDFDWIGLIESNVAPYICDHIKMRCYTSVDNSDVFLTATNQDDVSLFS